MTKSIAAAIIVLIVSAASTRQAQARSPEPLTEAAVIAADHDWMAAERRGDVAALAARLADGYRDIEANGAVHSKSDLLAFTAKRINKATGSVDQIVAEARAQHPIIEKVLIVGETAVLSFHSVDPAEQAWIRSVDVFAYQNGMWRGILSDHANVPAPAK